MRVTQTDGRRCTLQRIRLMKARPLSRHCWMASADINARDTDGLTPLHFAALFNESPAIITTLLDAGADATAKDSDGKTPFDYAN